MTFKYTSRVVVGESDKIIKTAEISVEFKVSGLVEMNNHSWRISQSCVYPTWTWWGGKDI